MSGETKEAAWFLALQFAAHQLDEAKEELKLVDRVMAAINEIESSKMILVSCDDELKLFQKFKGAAWALSQFKEKQKKQDEKVKKLPKP